MAKKPSASLIAHKVINLAGDLSASEKRVLGVLIDCYNFKTHQCDPALNSIAKLLRLSRRTVIRAINSLALKGYLQKVKHGGYFHRNSYQPNWLRFQLDEESWAAHRRQSRYQKSGSNVAPSEGQPCHIDGDGTGTQTTPLIKSPETSTSQPLSEGHDAGDRSEKGHSIKMRSDPPEYFEMAESAEVAERLYRPRTVGGPDNAMRNAILAGGLQLQRRVKRDLYIAWFWQLEFEENVDGCLVFSVPTKFKRTKLEQDFPTVLKECFCPKVPGVSATRVVVRT